MAEKCENCGDVIGALETPYLFRDHTDHIVCAGCLDKLRRTQAVANMPAGLNPAPVHVPYASPATPSAPLSQQSLIAVNSAQKQEVREVAWAAGYGVYRVLRILLLLFIAFFVFWMIAMCAGGGR